MKASLSEILEKNKIMVIDGSMSTALERLGADNSSSLWTAAALADNPELVKQVHLDYFRAGADCGITCSYQATIPGLTEHGYSHEEAEKLMYRLMHKISDNYDDIVRSEERNTEDADTLIVCYGGTMRAATEAMERAREKGMKVGIFRPITIWPFPERELKKLSSKVKKILVAEHNYGQIVLEVERIVKNDCKVDFIGKVNGTVITPDELVKKLEEAE